MMAPLSAGNRAKRTRNSSSQDLEDYMRLTDDQNPLHTSGSREGRFGAPIIRGMLLTGIISVLIGTQLLGPNPVYVSQELRFIHPMLCGGTVTAACRVTQVYPKNGQARLRVQTRNQKQEPVLSGYAVVLPP